MSSAKLAALVHTRSLFIDRDLDPEEFFVDTGLFDAFEIPGVGILFLLDNMGDFGMQSVLVTDKHITPKDIEKTFEHRDVPSRADIPVIAAGIIAILQEVYPELKPVVIAAPAAAAPAA